MAKKEKAGIYSPISLEALKIIASEYKQTPRLLLAYMTLSRFAGQEAIGGFAANRVIGAGAEAIRKSQNIRWERANELLKKLLQLNVIEPAPPGLKVGKSSATYVLKHIGDVNVPHALIDGLKTAPGIARLLEVKYQATPDVITSAIVTLIHCYKHLDMHRWGGISPHMIFQNWQLSSGSEGRGHKAVAWRDGDLHPVGSTLMCSDVLATIGVPANAENRSAWIPIFRAGVRLLSESGLVYETVTVFDAHMNPLLPVRINDFHASHGSEVSVLETIPGSAFYEYEKSEKLWFFTSTDLVAIDACVIGISRPRFRGADAATKQGIERDQSCIAAHKKALVMLDMIDEL